jgi:hypothetical protein
MGIWKNLRTGAAFMREYQQDAMKTVPRWARVVRVGRRVFGMVGVDVEIHYGRTPAHMESVYISVPRRMQLQAGQDVFVVGPDTSSDSNHTTWILDLTLTRVALLASRAVTAVPLRHVEALYERRLRVL